MAVGPMLQVGQGQKQVKTISCKKQKQCLKAHIGQRQAAQSIQGTIQST